MGDFFSELKFFRSFRIPVESADNVRFCVEKELALDRHEDISDVKVHDISVEGMGLSTASHLPLEQELRIGIQFKKMLIEVEGRVVRAVVAGEDSGRIYYGVSLEEERDMVKFLKKYIESLSPDRLKDCLRGLSLDERRGAGGEGPELFSLLVSLFRRLGELAGQKDFLPVILKEAGVILGAQRVGVFIIDPEHNRLRSVESLGAEEGDISEYHFRRGIPGCVFTTGSPLNMEAGSEETRAMAEREGVKSVICYPIRNSENKVVGVVEAVNKKGETRFYRDDETVVHVFSLILGLIFEEYNPFSVHSKVRPFAPPFDREHAIIGQSPAIKSLRKTILKLKDVPEPILIKGEPGVGKSLLARILHAEGGRGFGPWETLDCRYLNEDEIGRTLFGPEGLLKQARGGGLLLQSVHALSYRHQNLLCEAFQNPAMRWRIFLTSDEDLEAKVVEGLFHPRLFDIFLRVVVEIPPLRQRSEDVESLIHYFLKLECRKQGFLLKSFSKKLIDEFSFYSFPGNVTELKRYVSMAVTLNPKAHVISKLDELVMTKLKNQVKGGLYLDELPPRSQGGLSLKERLCLVERKMIEEDIRRLGGNKSRAAREMGISREALRKKLHHSQKVLDRLGREMPEKEEKKAA